MAVMVFVLPEELTVSTIEENRGELQAFLHRLGETPGEEAVRDAVEVSGE